MILTQIFCSSIKTAGPQVSLLRETVCLWHLNKDVYLRNCSLSSTRFYNKLTASHFILQTFLNIWCVLTYTPYSSCWVNLLVNALNSIFFLCKPPIMLCKRAQRLLSFHWNQDKTEQTLRQEALKRCWSLVFTIQSGPGATTLQKIKNKNKLKELVRYKV